MRKFSRSLAGAAVAAIAFTGPVALGAAPASAAGAPAQAASVQQISAQAAAGPIECHPAKLRAKAKQHQKKADQYRVLRHRELQKAHPSKKKVKHYAKMANAHDKKAAAYKARAKRCEDADNNA
ncbi:hypothetical protein [Streptomyces sp. ODS28]|uniref:hypothetical protein n=1 Tax=Streptomyces sp. ODS28 TaxID=3136688 RepID=UPI0031EE33CA